MTTFLLIVALIVALLFIYALVVRPWLKTKPWTAGFFAKIDSLELVLFKKSETILVGRLLWVGGLFVTFYDGIATFVQSLDITPITTRIFDYLSIPPDMRNLSVTAFVGILGLLINKLRNATTKPIELVAVSDKAVAANPKVAEAIAMADATKTEAVNVVADAKAG
jgi:hypothetical protein